MARRPIRQVMLLMVAVMLAFAAAPAAGSVVQTDELPTTKPNAQYSTPLAAATLDAWYQADATLFYEDGSTSTYEIVLGPDSKYRVLGQHRDGSEEVFHARGVQNVVFRVPGHATAQSFVHSEHFAIDALREVLADSNGKPSSRVSLGTRHGGTFVFDEGAIREISAADGAADARYSVPLDIANQQAAGVDLDATTRSAP